MANIQFNPYTSPEQEENVVDITVGIFFDGTLNNKNNTDEKKANSPSFQAHGKNKDQDTSYYNDWSNVARLWDCYKPDDRIYIEGIGTRDKNSDATNGYAFGAGATGIKEKVKKGCEKIFDRMGPIGKSNRNKINKLTLDVFGFSRGAAAARFFVANVSKPKSKPEMYYPPGQNASPVPVDDFGYFTSLKELPPRGLLGQKILEAGITVELIEIRFLGIFDTVSSYSENFTPTFGNDVAELSLNTISKARNIVHFTAENEHRENFDLTRVPVGVEKSLPGVHSDIGGSYNDGIEVVEEIETSWTLRSRLDDLKQKLISECWYKEKQLIYTGGNVYWALEGTRKLYKTYSYIPLHFMGQMGAQKNLPLNPPKLENKYSIAQDPLLVRVKQRLESYVLENGKKYQFKWLKDTPEAERQEQADFRILRNQYLHWSARREGFGMDPRSDRVRVVH